MTEALVMLTKVKSMQASFKVALLDADWEQIKSLDTKLRALMSDAVRVVTANYESNNDLRIELRNEVKQLIEAYTTCIEPGLETHQKEIKFQLRELNTSKKCVNAYRKACLPQ